MYSIKSMPSTSSVLSAYTTFTASAMLVRTVIKEVQTLTNQIIPKPIQEMILSKLGAFARNQASSQMTIVIEEFIGYSINQLYEASEIYLRTKINASHKRVKVSMSPKEKILSLTINRGEKIIDEFQGIKLIWKFTSKDDKDSSPDGAKNRAMELSFDKEYMEEVLNSYLTSHIIESSKAIKEENQVVKLYALGNFGGEGNRGGWSSTNLDHPATFDKIAMDPSLKQALIDDLDRFSRRRDFYRRVGKAWKRGYLLYGPPGTGKSSLIAAMANYLKFNIYDLELASISSNSRLRNLLVSSSNRSILVIEDIDCSIELQDRRTVDRNNNSQLTLSGLLNFIDGLWSSCGDERIIVFTTNHKDRLDPALLRPGRMDMHIHMSYCTPSGFRILVSNYLGINNHELFPRIDELMTEVQATPAEIAEELMKSEDVDIVLEGLIKLLQRKKTESIEGETEVGDKRKAREEIEVNENINVDDGDQWKAKKMRILMRDQADLRQASSVPWFCGAEPIGN
ncbi:hypothetical protein JRO89_XS05G0111100 [Xanthoceras sorbifolium]|uniref:AAA+ ATPase domain-containing protein n=1 Tax=Xanthoceras sorbifolium TaxID=99658 RepID=A0ABQ8I1G7_9ROSI|nr:hypothetical protein JRO89_XS05G0111100 [Xanthoceras sorbifolium]